MDINRANRDELMSIEGIDDERARLIMEYRRSHGPFHDWDEVAQVPGIGDVLTDKVKAMATFGRGERTSQARQDEKRAHAPRPSSGRSGRGKSARTRSSSPEAEREPAPARKQPKPQPRAEAAPKAGALAPQQVMVLGTLAELDAQAAAGYRLAAESAGHPDVTEQLQAFAEDHERHVQDLTAVLERYGEKSAKASGSGDTLLERLARAAQPLEIWGAVIGMLANEHLTNSAYELALTLAEDWPDDIREMLERNLGDEERHFEWLAQAEDELTTEAAANANGEGAQEEDETTTEAATVEIQVDDAGRSRV